MSDRKGRRPPLTSEIKSVLRGPGDSDSPESGEAAVDESESPNAETAADETDETDEDDGDGRDDGDAHPHLKAVSDGEADEDTESFLQGLVEALLFTSQRPLSLKEIARSAGVDRMRARQLVEALIASYEPRGLNVEEVAGGYVMRSSPRYATYVQKLLALRPVRLSRAQLETLAIVAYRQPVTKPEVDDIRGVDSGQVIKGLLERNLLKILGKKDEPGRPMLYGTTNDFLELLNLRSLEQLPTLREYTELSEESRQKFESSTGEEAPEGPIDLEQGDGTPPSEDGEPDPSDGDGGPGEAKAATSDPATSDDDDANGDDDDDANGDDDDDANGDDDDDADDNDDDDADDDDDDADDNDDDADDDDDDANGDDD